MSAADITRILAEISANGGQITPQPNKANGLPRFALDYAAGADRRRCRAAVAELKADPAALRTALEIVHRNRKAEA